MRVTKGRRGPVEGYLAAVQVAKRSRVSIFDGAFRTSGVWTRGSPLIPFPRQDEGPCTITLAPSVLLSLAPVFLSERKRSRRGKERKGKVPEARARGAVSPALAIYEGRLLPSLKEERSAFRSSARSKARAGAFFLLAPEGWGFP